jgi:hypothetical protein
MNICTQAPGREAMSEAHSISPFIPTSGQLQLVAQKYGVYRGKSLADVGCGDGKWLQPLKQRGLAVQGMEERKRLSAEPTPELIIGSPAAAVPWAAHSLDRIVLRGTSVLECPPFGPEILIALANLGSSLKRSGRLLIPVAGEDSPDVQTWGQQLAIFPGTTRVVTISSGLKAYLTLAFLFGGNHRLTLVEFAPHRRLTSRLEWHRLAREAVLRRMQPPAAA